MRDFLSLDFDSFWKSTESSWRCVNRTLVRSLSEIDCEEEVHCCIYGTMTSKVGFAYAPALPYLSRSSVLQQKDVVSAVEYRRKAAIVCAVYPSRSESSGHNDRDTLKPISALIGRTCQARVQWIAKFGAFVKLEDHGLEGLVHVSEITEKFVSNVEDYVAVGQLVSVRVLGEDNRGRPLLSMKKALTTGYARVVALGGDGGHPWNDDGQTKWANLGSRSAASHYPWEPDPRLFTFDHASIPDPRPVYKNQESS